MHRFIDREDEMRTLEMNMHEKAVHSLFYMDVVVWEKPH